MFKTFFLLLIASFCLALNAQNIKSIQLTSNNQIGEMPILELGSRENILVEFDDLDESDNDFCYRLIHCNADWETSSLLPIEYLKGFNEILIQEVELSDNTLCPYINYRFEVPGRDQEILKSGNYKIEVFACNEPKKLVVEMRFYVYEKKADIGVQVIRPKRVEFSRSKQELEISVNASSGSFHEAYRTVKTYIQQNLNPHSLRKIEYSYNNANTLVYKDKDDLLYDGNNEHRNFDIRPISYGGKNVEKIRRGDRIYEAILYEEYKKAPIYTEIPDLNGAYVIKAEKKDQSRIQADYVNVLFPFNAKDFYPDSKIYVLGSFNQWKLQAENEMIYDGNRQMYYADILLKQGFYDYSFLRVKNGKLMPLSEFENSFQETENNYFVFVYYADPAKRYDELIGIQKINTRNQ